jgi:hypothetical protein
MTADPHHDDLLRPDGRLTDLALEQLHAGVLDEATAARAEQHLAHHAEDAARYEALRADSEAFAARAMPDWLAAAPADTTGPSHTADPSDTTRPSDVVHPPQLAKPANSWWPALLSVAALALVAVGLTSTPSTHEGALHDEVRIKGGVAMKLVLDRPGGAERLDDGAEVDAGARIGIQVAIPSAGHVAVLGADATGSAYDIWPKVGGSRASDGPIETAIRLDGTPGFEWLLAIHCEAPFDVSPLREQLARASAAQDRKALPTAPDGCSLAHSSLQKPAE